MNRERTAFKTLFDLARSLEAPVHWSEANGPEGNSGNSTIAGTAPSPLKARFLMAEKGLDIDTIDVDLRALAHR